MTEIDKLNCIEGTKRLEDIITAEREIVRELVLETARRVFETARKYLPNQALPEAYRDQDLPTNTGNYAVG